MPTRMEVWFLDTQEEERAKPGQNILFRMTKEKWIASVRNLDGFKTGEQADGDRPSTSLVLVEL